jgi:uncharacterized protein YkwD
MDIKGVRISHEALMLRLLTIITLSIFALVTPAYAGATHSNDLAHKVNDLRKKHNVRQLNINKKVTKVAQHRAEKLVKIQKLKHNPNLWDQLPPSTAVGEIISKASTWRGGYQSFKHSPEHRAVMLSKTFRQEGVGLARDSHGILWVVVVFRRPA